MIIKGADKEGNDIYVDIRYKCPICKNLHDTYELAKECRETCIEEIYGCIQEVEINEEPEYNED